MEADQLIKDIARMTGLRLDKSDPILAAAVINDLLLEQALLKLDRQVKVQADRVTAASMQAVIDAKKEAEALLTEAGEWIDARMKTAAESAAEFLSAELRRETETTQRARRAMVCAAWFLAIASVMAVSGVAGFLLETVH